MTLHASFSAPGTGIELNALDAVHTLKIGAADTDGRYELFEIHAPRGHVVPPHRHGWLEAYYVLGGRLTAHVDGTAHHLSPGAALTVPPHALHTLAPVSPAASFLVFTLGDAMGRFFTDLHATLPAGRPLPEVVQLVMDVAERHGVTFVQPAGS